MTTYDDIWSLKVKVSLLETELAKVTAERDALAADPPLVRHVATGHGIHHGTEPDDIRFAPLGGQS